MPTENPHMAHGKDCMEKLKLLIAEDSKTIRTIYADILDREQFDIRYAEHGIAAVELYATWNPQVIMLDLTMPLMSGYDALVAIRESDSVNRTTIIMATSNTEKKSIVQCAKVGIQGYIVKSGNWYEDDLTGRIVAIHQKHISQAA